MGGTSISVVGVRRAAYVSGLVLAAFALLSSWGSPGALAATTTPVLTISPSSGSHPYENGESVGISVGPNSRFTPYSKIEVLECAAPKGVLPVDDSTCDGNTAQAGSILAAANGSFRDSTYTLYRLPSSALGEQNNHLPVCGTSEECVLYIGQNQNDFTQPKMFSPPFTIAATRSSGTATSTAGGPVGAGVTAGKIATGSMGRGSAGTGSAGTGSAGTGSAGSSTLTRSGSGALGGSSTPNSSSKGAAGTLAFTGPPVWLPWLLGAALLMTLVGIAGRRFVRSRRS
jgi:hypothetical protein